MPHLFFNGPVQNGDFTFAVKPGKAVGIRIAGALNRILGAPAVPHLWNTVTLAGDLRYLQHIEAAQVPISRQDFEASIIAAKYGNGLQPSAGTATDTDKSVADLAMAMIMDGLSLGTLRIGHETILECVRCEHMLGTRHHPCRACGHDISRTRTARHLTSHRKPGEPVLDFARIHAGKRRPPLHLQNIAANTPTWLILSRTRSYGIDLSPVGLPGLVLDPRRTFLTKSSELGQDILEDIRQSIREGDTDWIMSRTALAAAMRIRWIGGRSAARPTTE